MLTTWYCSRIRETPASSPVWRVRCILTAPPSPSTHIMTRRGNRTVICSSTFDRNRTRRCVCAPTYSRDRLVTFTYRRRRHERLREKYLPTLKRIRKMGDKARRDYVRKCDREFVDCISECAKNVIKGNVPLTHRQKVNLRPKRHDLRAVSARKTSLRPKRKIMQKGGFLAALLPPVLSVLASLLAN